MKKIKEIMNLIYFPFLFLMFFINVSGYGKNMFNGYGTSIVLVIFFFLIYLKNFTKIPAKINYMYIILIMYSVIMTIIGGDWNNFIVSIFSVSSFAIFLNKNIADKIIKKSFSIIGIMSLLILVEYNHIGGLDGWNANTIGMGCCIGCCAFVALYCIEEKKIYKYINLILTILSLYELILIKNRNAILICFIVLVFIKFINKANMSLKKGVCLGLVFSPMIFTKLFMTLSSSELFKQISNISKQIFGKDTIMSGREWFWEKAREYIGENCLFGTGKSLYNMHFYAHNMYYSIIYSFGIIGYLIYSLFIYIICKVILQNTKDVISICCISIATANFIGQIMENTLFTANFAAYLPYLFLSVALGRTIKENKNEKINDIYSDV